MTAMGVRSRSLLVTELLVLVGGGAAKIINIDWDTGRVRRWPLKTATGSSSGRPGVGGGTPPKEVTWCGS